LFKSVGVAVLWAWQFCAFIGR